MARRNKEKEEDIRSKLRECHPELLNMLEVTDLFLNFAVSHGALNGYTKHKVTACKNDHEKVRVILQHIQQDPIPRYDGFLKALTATEQAGALQRLDDVRLLSGWKLVAEMVGKPFNDIAWFQDGSLLAGTSRKVKRIFFSEDYKQIKDVITMYRYAVVRRVATAPDMCWAFCNDRCELFFMNRAKEMHRIDPGFDVLITGVALTRKTIIMSSQTHIYICDRKGVELMKRELPQQGCAPQFIMSSGDEYVIYTTNGEEFEACNLTRIGLSYPYTVTSVSIGEPLGVTCDRSKNIFVICRRSPSVGVYLVTGDLHLTGQVQLQMPTTMGKPWTLSILDSSENRKILVISDGANGNTVFFKLKLA